MAQELTFASSLSDGSGGVRLWLDYHAYAKRLLIAEDANPWANAGTFLAFFSQAQGLLRPEAAILDVKDLYQSWLKSDAKAKTELAGKRRPMAALKYLFEAEAPRALLREIITAVSFQLKGSVPLVLSVPSPRHWLWWAVSESTGADMEVLADDAENAAVYLADFVRAFSDLSLSGVLLVERPHVALPEANPFVCYKPVFNVAKHYRWPVALRLPTAEIPEVIDASDVSLVIGSAPAAAPSTPSGMIWAVDVGGALWSGQDLPSLAAGQIFFVEIPADEIPEKVLEGLGTVRKALG